ncbi:unnamed protein product [Amoebophrya sp. A120]|nr:unnamed protein product [Amoebophrya sp. A120]|eukprot:GSA120T00000874001.1
MLTVGVADVKGRRNTSTIPSHISSSSRRTVCGGAFQPCTLSRCFEEDQDEPHFTQNDLEGEQQYLTELGEDVLLFFRFVHPRILRVRPTRAYPEGTIY